MKGAEIENVFAAIRRTGLVPRGALALTEDERVGELAHLAQSYSPAWQGAKAGVLRRVARGQRRVGRSARPLEPAADRGARGRTRRQGAVSVWRSALFAVPAMGATRRTRPFLADWRVIHPHYGLWHSYRGALGFPEALMCPSRRRPQSCEYCIGRWCLKSCPVGAFSDPGYDVAACADHLRSAAGADCMDAGCRARAGVPGRRRTRLRARTVEVLHGCVLARATPVEEIKPRSDTPLLRRSGGRCV